MKKTFFESQKQDLKPSPPIFAQFMCISQACLSAFLGIILFYTFSYQAEGRTCREPKEEDKNKNVFCFFSLNNPQEQTTFKKKYHADNIEVKEFYGKDNKGKSIEAQFKKMLTDSECDCLIISGHHKGYFDGDQSKNKELKDQSLDLDFMENMSCEEGCEAWFSNIRCLFLMGCQTVESVKMRKSDESADSETIRVAHSGYFDNREIHQKINQAYSSTLDQNARLSHRYLSMFPESSLYGWADRAPGLTAYSENSLPNFIQLVQSLNKTAEEASTEQEILQFINFMNNSANTCQQYSAVTGTWARHWEEGTKATACFLNPLSQTKEQFKEYHKRGCALTRAIGKEDKDAKEINQALESILSSGEQGIKANFNRLMSLVTSSEHKEQKWYPGVKEKLKNSQALKGIIVQNIESPKTGFVRKSDYLYFYKEMDWVGENKERDQHLSQIFLQQLQKAFEEIKKPQPTAEGTTTVPSKVAQKAHHTAVFKSIAQNKIGGWLSKNTPEQFKKLKNQFLNSEYSEDERNGSYLSYLQHNPSPEDIQSADKIVNVYLDSKNEGSCKKERKKACNYKNVSLEECNLYKCS